MGTKRTNDGQVKEKKKNDKKRALNDEDQVSKAIEDDVEGENPDLGGDVVKEEQEEEVEVEAISHAEQRKRRKLEKKKLAEAAANGVDGANEAETDTNKQPNSDKTAKKADSKASEKESRSGFGVWVGNLAFRTDAAKVGWQNPSHQRTSRLKLSAAARLLRKQDAVCHNYSRQHATRAQGPFWPTPAQQRLCIRRLLHARPGHRRRSTQ